MNMDLMDLTRIIFVGSFIGSLIGSNLINVITWLSLTVAGIGSSDRAPDY